MDFSSLPFPMDPQQTHHPWLLVSKGENLQEHTFYNASTDEYFEREIIEFHNKEVRQVSPTSQGWLALMDYENMNGPADCFLLNTGSKERIQLPPLESTSCKLPDCILSKPTTDPDCRVLFLSNYSETIFFCRLHDEEFTKRTLYFGTDYLSAAINFNGTIYAWMSDSGNFVTVDFRGDEIVLTPLLNDAGCSCQVPRTVRPPRSNYINNCFVDCFGELMLVQMLNNALGMGLWEIHWEIHDFWIFKVDISKRECSEVDSIGERAFFIPGGMAVSCSEISGIEEETIYLTWDGLVVLWHYDCRGRTDKKPCAKPRKRPSHMAWLIL